MSVLSQCALIFAFSLAGECLHEWLPFPIPAGVYGFTLLLAGLMTKAVKLRQVETVGQFLTSLLPLIFVPVLVGALAVPALPTNALWVAGILSAASTLVVMCVSGLVAQRCLPKGRREG